MGTKNFYSEKMLNSDVFFIWYQEPIDLSQIKSVHHQNVLIYEKLLLSGFSKL